jgi:hypothetical protein
MTDIEKRLKNAGQDAQAKAQSAKEHMEGKPSSETFNKAKIKAQNAARDLQKDL